jgi:adenylate cyclase
VVGIPVPLRLYELLDFKADASTELLEMINAWESAFKAFESRNFQEAKNAFAAVYEKNPEDLPAKLYLSRCEKYIASPLPSNWDGVDNLMEK